MRSLVIKEINAFFNHITGYLILSVFLLAIGLIVWVFPDTSVLQYGFADLEALFTYVPYVFVFLVPAITMRMIAEEKKEGTWELLMTSPLRPHHIVLAKYFAAMILVGLSVIPTLVYYFSIYQLGNPPGNMDSAGFFGSFIGLFLIGAVFAAVGVFSSSLTENQITAFVLGVFMSFLIYFGMGALADLQVLGSISLMVEELSLAYHYGSISRGVIDSGDLFYFFASIGSLLVVTIIMVRRK